MEKKLKSASLFQGTLFELTRDEIMIENGNHATRDIVHHPGGVGVIVLQEHHILLVKQYRYAMQCELFEIPAGKLEPGEDPAICGKRELEEETGYCCNSLHLFTIMASTPGFCTEKIYLYETADIYKIENPKAMDEDEDITVHWIHLDDAYQMILDGRIWDAKTIIAIQHAYTKERSLTHS